MGLTAMSDGLEQIREDLQGALDTARATWQVNGGERCPGCGAIGRQAQDPSARDDGTVLHDPECLFVVLPSVIEGLPLGSAG